MRKLIMKMSISVDGFVSTANGKNDWVFKTGDEESKAYSLALGSGPGLLIMGRKTFDVLAAYWPTASGPFAEPMNTIPKALFTQQGIKSNDPGHTTTAGENAKTYNAAKGIVPNADASAAEISWGNARVFDGDLAEEIRKLKAEPGKPIAAIGGAGFMQSLIATGLIDEYHLFVHPVALGSGFPIFAGLTDPFYLKLVDVKTFPGGVIAKTFLPA